MTGGWKTVKLGDVCALDKQSYGGSSLPYIGMEDVDSGGTGRFFGSREAQTVKSNTFQFGPQHLLYGRLRPYLNKVLLPDFEGHCSTEIFPVLCKDELDRSFLFYWLTSASVVEKINKTCTGARMPRANFKEVLKFNFRLPPLEEQKRIVAILDEAFEGIEKAQANAQQNLANARELFENGLQTIFLNKKEIWEEKRLNQLGEIQTGYTPKTIDKTNFGDFIPFIKPGDFRPDGSLSYSNQGLSKTGIKQSRIIKNGSVLMVCIGATIGKVGVCNRDIATNQQINSLKPYKGVSERFLYYQMLIPSFQQDVIHNSGQATLPIINKGKWSGLKVLIPRSEQEQTEIVKRLDMLLEQSQRLEAIYEQKLKDLAELKQSLLQKAFSGELTSSNVVAFTRPVSDQLAVATTSPVFAANVLAYAHNWHASQQRDRTFGRVKAQKVLHMAESVAGVDMGRQPIKDAAGPNDFQHMLRAEDWAKNNLFFEFTSRLTGNGYDFKKLENYNKLIGGALEAVKPYKDKLEKIIALMMPMNTREAEVLATVHAAWNNLLLDNVTITDEVIIHEARENWTESKRSIPEHEFRKAITTIRNNGIVPDGTARRVTGQESLPL